MRTATFVAIAFLLAILTVPGFPLAPGGGRIVAALRRAPSHGIPTRSQSILPQARFPLTGSCPGWPTRTEIPFNNSSVSGNFLSHERGVPDRRDLRRCAR